jgi:hypothetical protein
MKRIRKGWYLVLVVGFLLLYLGISHAEEWFTYACYGSCTGCQCWGNYSVVEHDNCCGNCISWFWYGWEDVVCCVVGMGCHFREI